MIDAHCHLYSAKYDMDLEAVIQRAKEFLQAVIVSAVDLKSLRKSLSLRRQHPDFVHVSGGIHPRSAASLKKWELEQVWQTLSEVQEEIVAIGEVGPDFYRTKDSDMRRRQLYVLEEAMAQAEGMNLPLVIHARQAEAAALGVVSNCRTPVLFHCFAGSRKNAEEITGLGFYLSFSAILLFNPELQKIATQVPVEHILVETDSPALSPHRSQRRNEPAFLEIIVSRLAQLLDYSFGEMASLTAANARRFYGLADL